MSAGTGLNTGFHKMNLIAVPVFLIDSVLLPVKIQLEHSEHDRNIFRLPLLFIGIAVFHANLPHYAAAFGIFSVVGRRNVWDTVFF